MPIVAMPDGAHVSFPDEMPPDQIRSLILQKFPDAGTQPNVGADMAKSAGIGAVEGAIGSAGMPGDIGSMVSGGVSKLGDAAGVNPTTVDTFKQAMATALSRNPFTAPFAEGPTSAQIQGGIEKATGPFYQPQTTAGKYARTVGQFLPAAIGGPESFATKLATRVAAPAIGSEAAGEATEGTALEPYARLGGALVGAGIPAAMSRVISPSTIRAVDRPAVDTLANEGVQITAGQKSGSKVLQYLESELGDSLGAGNKATAANERTLEQFTGAAFRRAGIDGVTRSSPELMDSAFKANGNAFDSIAERNPSIPIPGFDTAAAKIVDEFKSATNADTAPALEGFINKISSSAPEFPPEKMPLINQLRQQGISDADIAKTVGAPTATKSGVISGDAYQNIQSQIARAARNATDPNVKLSLFDLRSALDNSAQAGLRQIGNASDADAWMAARRQYKDLLVLERAMSKTTETAAKGLITPTALAEADRAIAGRRNFVTGRSTFSDLAQAGNAKMKPLPQSGTSPRLAARLLPSLIGAGMGAGLGDITGTIGGLAAPIMLGKAIMSRPVQAYLANQVAVPLRQVPLSRKLLASGIFASAPQRIDQGR